MKTNPWEYHDTKMRELKKIYINAKRIKIAKIQSLINIFDFNKENIYLYATNKEKKLINNLIDEWCENYKLNDIFKIQIKKIKQKSKIKKIDILNILINFAYIEENEKNEPKENNIFYEDANFYYKQSQQEYVKANKTKRKISNIDIELFLLMFSQMNVKGYILKDYKKMLINYQSSQLLRQILIDIMQNKEINIINDPIYQNLFDKQDNTKLKINDDKISGDIDLTLIGILNKVKVEGYKEQYNKDQDAPRQEEEQKEVKKDKEKKSLLVEFVAVIDDRTTRMCRSLNGQIFDAYDFNRFSRYYGEDSNHLELREFNIPRLMLGMNLPPISHHNHFCRSTIKYIKK